MRCQGGSNAEVWAILNGEHLRTIEIEQEEIRCVAVSDEFIVAVGWDSASYNLYISVHSL